MDTYVVNLDTAVERWDEISSHLEQWDIVPIRWQAIEPHDIEAVEWSVPYPVPDAPRRIAILRSYVSLLRHLKDSEDDMWLILQDDSRFRSAPLPGAGLIHLYGGYTLRNMAGFPYVANPWAAKHVCPRAFQVRRPILDQLIEAWGNETVQSCMGWAHLLTEATTTFEDPPLLLGEYA